MKNHFALTFLLLFFIAVTANAQGNLKTGVWRGVLKTATGKEVPFNFEVYDTAGHQQLSIINGNERLKVLDVKSIGDSVFIKMPLFDSEFRLKREAGNLKGRWIKHLGDRDASMNFTATADTKWRFFKDTLKPAFDITGRWATIFGEVKSGKNQPIGEFKQAGTKLTGTFLSTTGDYRYLEGVVKGNKIFLSCFDGGHAYLFTGEITDATTISNGKFYAGFSGLEKWTALKNENARLPDAYSLTTLKPGYKKLNFTFKDITGNNVSLTDSRFKNKVVIVQILGSWCPNCMDETNFLVNNYYKRYRTRGVEIVGLAYERTTDFSKSQKTLQQLKMRFNIPYPLLITGFTDKKGDAAKSLPMLTSVVGFPTTIIIDKKGDVRKIHTGFSGPGTGVYYTQFIEEFDKLTDKLLEEK